MGIACGYLFNDEQLEIKGFIERAMRLTGFSRAYIKAGIFPTPESRLTHRVYKALLGDPKKGTMHIKIGAKWHMETSATAVGWAEALGKEAAQKAAKEYALPQQNEQFLQALHLKNTLANMNI